MSVYLLTFSNRSGESGQAYLRNALDRYTHTWLSDSCVALASHKSVDSLWIEFASALEDGCKTLHVMALEGPWKGAGGGSSDQWLGIHLDGNA